MLFYISNAQYDSIYNNNIQITSYYITQDTILSLKHFDKDINSFYINGKIEIKKHPFLTRIILIDKNGINYMVYEASS